MHLVRRIAGLALVLATALMGPGTAAAASAYKWVDGAGITHYSQFPPPDAIPAQRLVLPAAPRARGATDAQSIRRQLQRFATLDRADRARPRVALPRAPVPAPATEVSAAGTAPLYVPVVPYPGLYPAPFRFHPRRHRDNDDRGFPFRAPPGLVPFGAFVPAPAPPAARPSAALGSVLTRELLSR